MSPSEALYKTISFKMKVTIMDIFFSTQYINPGDEECLKQCATKAEHLYVAFFFFTVLYMSQESLEVLC